MFIFENETIFLPLRYKKRFEMRNTKIYSILEQFDKYEQNRCRKFLQSPYFNRDQTIVELFNLLLEQINNRAEEEITKEEIWKSLNLEGCYDDVRFRKYFSDLTKLTEDFLCQQIYEKNQLQKSSHLLQALAEKKIEKLYSSSIKSAQKHLQCHPYKTAVFYYYNYSIENELYKLIDYETKRDEKANFEIISSNIDYFYLAEKLRVLCGALSRQSVTSYTYNILIKDEIINYLKENFHDYKTIPPIALYFQVYCSLVEPENEEHYFQLKELLDKYALFFPLEEATQIYTFAQNYCVRKLNQGNQKFVRELFILYKILLERNIIIVDGVLSPWYFRNIVTIGLRLGENEWVENFILQYQIRLPEEMRENAVSFNLAHVYFYQKRYSKVIELLRIVDYEDLTYNLNSKSLLLIAYYELQEIEPLYSLFESFRTYLNRHKDIPLSRRQGYSDLIKFTKKLTKIIPGDNKNIEKVKLELEATKNVANHSWLMEKIAELED